METHLHTVDLLTRLSKECESITLYSDRVEVLAFWTDGIPISVFGENLIDCLHSIVERRSACTKRPLPKLRDLAGREW